MYLKRFKIENTIKKNNPKNDLKSSIGIPVNFGLVLNNLAFPKVLPQNQIKNVRNSVRKMVCRDTTFRFKK